MYCCMIVPDKGQNSTNIPVQLELCWVEYIFTCYWILVQGRNLNPLSEREVDHGTNCN